MDKYNGIDESSPFREDFQEMSRTARDYRRYNTGDTVSPGTLQQDNLIHESFPSMASVKPTYKGSQSMAPTKDWIGGDSSQKLPESFYDKRASNRAKGK